MEEEVQSEEAASNLRELHLPESSTSETSGQNEAHTDGLVAEVYIFLSLRAKPTSLFTSCH